MGKSYLTSCTGHLIYPGGRPDQNIRRRYVAPSRKQVLRIISPLADFLVPANHLFSPSLPPPLLLSPVPLPRSFCSRGENRWHAKCTLNKGGDSRISCSLRLLSDAKVSCTRFLAASSRNCARPEGTDDKSVRNFVAAITKEE